MPDGNGYSWLTGGPGHNSVRRRARSTEYQVDVWPGLRPGTIANVQVGVQIREELDDTVYKPDQTARATVEVVQDAIWRGDTLVRVSSRHRVQIEVFLDDMLSVARRIERLAQEIDGTQQFEVLPPLRPSTARDYGNHFQLRIAAGAAIPQTIVHFRLVGWIPLDGRRPVRRTGSFLIDIEDAISNGDDRVP